jgi:hypothetical protein
LVVADFTESQLELGARLGQLSSSAPDEVGHDERDALWRRPVAAGQRHAVVSEELDDALLARDRLIVEASNFGFSRREVARAAGVSPVRVQQILDR